MKKIPAEVLQEIFLLLPQRDKVEGMIVCRIWKRAIEESVLFHTVCLNDKQQFDNFISKCRQELGLSGKIERLIIDMEHMESVEMDLLPLMILNVHELYFFKNIENCNLRFTKTLSFHPWSKTIRKINEESSDIVTTHILKGGMCPDLTELKVCGTSVKLGRDFIRQLVNAPALKSLSLKNCNLSLDDLELLHKNTPLLSSFSMYTVDIDSAMLPIKIQPAIHMTSLTLSTIYTLTPQTHINLKNYMTMKYPRIATMKYGIFMRIFGSGAQESGFSSQLKQISPHLTSLTMAYSNNFPCFIPLLDRYNCKIKDFSLGSSMEANEVNILVQSKQAQYIQSLTLNSISSVKGVNYLRELPALTELNLNCISRTVQEGKITININTLLESVGSNLVLLRISQAKVVFDPSFSRQYSSLKCLELQNTMVPKKLDHFISKSFPRLRTLIIDDILESESTFYLGNINLASLQLRIKLPPKNPYVLVMTTSNNQVRWYTSKPAPKHRRTIEADPTDFPAVKSFPIDQSDSLPCMAFVCNSVCDFFLVNLADPQQA